jgi:hypothetical protein
MTRVSWPAVLAHARAIVESYDTGVTLRQLFYRLVADGTLPNTQHKYRYHSEVTAKARRTASFPELLDRTSRIERGLRFSGAGAALDWLLDMYRRDRTEGQPWTIYLGVEKAGLSAQLRACFGDDLGVPIVALGGYASQTLADAVRRDIVEAGRPAVLVYAGDLDPTGEDIDRDFERRVGVFDKVVRVALTAEQVQSYALPFNPDEAVVRKLEGDSRAKAFVQRHGSLVQYEVDALPPETLRDLYGSAIESFWDDAAHRSVLAREQADLAELSG